MRYFRKYLSNLDVKGIVSQSSNEVNLKLIHHLYSVSLSFILKNVRPNLRIVKSTLNYVNLISLGWNMKFQEWYISMFKDYKKIKLENN